VTPTLLGFMILGLFLVPIPILAWLDRPIRGDD
jgi:hypothetical protein